MQSAPRSNARCSDMKQKEICHSRTGDKGDISNISLIPWNEAD